MTMTTESSSAAKRANGGEAHGQSPPPPTPCFRAPAKTLYPTQLPKPKQRQHMLTTEEPIPRPQAMVPFSRPSAGNPRNSREAQPPAAGYLAHPGAARPTRSAGALRCRPRTASNSRTLSRSRRGRLSQGARPNLDLMQTLGIRQERQASHRESEKAGLPQVAIIGAGRRRCPQPQPFNSFAGSSTCQVSPAQQ